MSIGVVVVCCADVSAKREARRMVVVEVVGEGRIANDCELVNG